VRELLADDRLSAAFFGACHCLSVDDVTRNVLVRLPVELGGSQLRSACRGLLDEAGFNSLDELSRLLAPGHDRAVAAFLGMRAIRELVYAGDPIRPGEQAAALSRTLVTQLDQLSDELSEDSAVSEEQRLWLVAAVEVCVHDQFRRDG
jgi:hypothetical protein